MIGEYDPLCILCISVDGMIVPVDRYVADKYRLSGSREWYTPPTECLPIHRQVYGHYVPQVTPFSGKVIQEMTLLELICGKARV